MSVQTLARISIIALLASFGALLSRGAPYVGDQDCDHRQAWDGVVQACQSYCAAPLQSCCEHEHMSLTWPICEGGGIKKVLARREQYFSAQNRKCQTGCPTTGAAFTCTHSVDTCTVTDC